MIRLIIIVIYFYPYYLNAQIKKNEKANRYYETHQYQKALENYLTLEQRTDINSFDKGQIQLKIASCYNHLHNPIDAEVYYSIAYHNGIILNTDQKIEYTKTLLETKKYIKAKEVLLTIDEGMYIEQILLDKIKFALSNSSIDSNIKVNSLESQKGYSSYGISILNDNLIFIHQVSSANLKNAINRYQFTNINGTKIRILNDLDFPNNFNSLSFDLHDSIIYYSGNISSLDKYYTSNHYDNKIGLGGINNLAIWHCSLLNKIADPKLLAYSNVDYSNTHPFVTKDGKTIYFASNMLGGYGDYDLYKIEKTDDGWSRPENLGKEINTFLNEGYPFYKQGVLYFSSEGHPGYGGLDIFKFEFSTHKLENMKKPINSSFDDFYYMHISPKKGYFSSNRESINGNDVYYIFEKK